MELSIKEEKVQTYSGLNNSFVAISMGCSMFTCFVAFVHLRGRVNPLCRVFLCCAVFSRSGVSDSLWPVDCSPPGSSVHGILQARTLEWVAMPSSRGSPQPRDQSQGSCTAGRFFTNRATRETQEVYSFIFKFQLKIVPYRVAVIKNYKTTQCKYLKIDNICISSF